MNGITELLHGGCLPGVGLLSPSSVRKNINLARAYKSGSVLDPGTSLVVKFYSSMFSLFPIHSFNIFFFLMCQSLY